MQPVAGHDRRPDAAFDGGDLDCGNGLLLMIRRHIDPLLPGQLLEIRSTDTSVEEDLPAWCRLTGNELVSWTRAGRQRSYLVSKGPLATAKRGDAALEPPLPPRATRTSLITGAVTAGVPAAIATTSASIDIRPFAVMGVGSWPRPRWLVAAMNDQRQGRISETEFEATADDGVRLTLAAQLRAGADVVTDGEQRRDSYCNFVGARLDNCQLVPLTDLLALVDDPEHLRREFEALDVPAADVRHPVLLGPLRRSRPLAVHELTFMRGITDKPVKVALPGPYLLSRVLWTECISENAYTSREELARDIVNVLREEIGQLLDEGAALVQLDEPVLTEVVYGGVKKRTSFMCGALSERADARTELAFARDLLAGVTKGFPRARLALHICRGNWTPDEDAALVGDYRPLLPLLAETEVGTYFLELCTPRAGEMEVLRDLPQDRRVGVGVVNPKAVAIEKPDDIAARIDAAVSVFGSERVLLVPDCGFATFAHNPVASAATAEAKLAAICRARTIAGV